MKKVFLFTCALLALSACAKESTTTAHYQKLALIDKPIHFGASRIAMTKEYIQKHYGKKVNDIRIIPKVIVLHWTADMSFKKSFDRLMPQKLYSDRKDIAAASALNVSSQFLIKRDGTIYRLMPETYMARHVIGLNYNSIGVENIGDLTHGLTRAQERANIALVKYLKNKYPTIRYLIGHHEYRQMESTSLWLEKDKGYRTVKDDPGVAFMSTVRYAVRGLHLKKPPKGL